MLQTTLCVCVVWMVYIITQISMLIFFGQGSLWLYHKMSTIGIFNAFWCREELWLILMAKAECFHLFFLHKTERMLHIVPCIHLSSPEGVWTAEVLWNRVLAQEMHEFLMQTQSNFTFSAFKLNNISWTFCHMNKYVCLTLSHGCVSQLNPSPHVSLSHKNISWWVLCEHMCL